MIRTVRSPLPAATAAILLVVMVAMVVVVGPRPASASGSAENPLFTEVALDQMTVDPPSAGAFVTVPDEHDSTWPNDVLGLWADGSATTTVHLRHRASSLVVAARADLCAGAPTMQVSVDGEVGLTQDVTTVTRGVYAVPGPWRAGDHTVEIHFLNDHTEAGCDRNLKIVHVGFLRIGAYSGYTLRGNDFTLDPADGVHYSSGPDGRPTLMMWNNSTATADVDLQNAKHIVVSAAGESCDGQAAMVVRIDGETVFSKRVSEQASDWDKPEYSAHFAHPVGPGVHHLEVSFVNDDLTPTCDRNLKVKEIRLWGLAGAWGGELHV